MADSLGLSSSGSIHGSAQGTEYVMTQRPLRRVLAFARRSLDQVINEPTSKRLVYGYYKLHKEIDRTCEAVEMERAWNPSGVLKF